MRHFLHGLAWRLWCKPTGRHWWTYPSWSYRFCPLCGFVKGLDCFPREYDSPAELARKAAVCAGAQYEWLKTRRVVRNWQ